jgi:hypothetical protein
MTDTFLDEPTDDERRNLSDLAEDILRDQSAIVRKTTELKVMLEVYRRKTEVDLPDAMRQAGQSEFKLLNGTPVELKYTLVAGQLDDYGEGRANLEGLDWVESHDGASLIRATVTAQFDAKDIEAAREVFEMIRRHPSANRLKSLNLKRMIPWNSLTSWVGELIRQMKDPPLELLGVRERKWAQVGESRPKQVELKGFVER